MGTIDEVIETVRGAREDGPDALAAMALSYGATMALGTVRIRALRGLIAEMREAARAADEMVATLRHERDAAQADCKQARESATDAAEVWRLRESVAALRAEREAFALRLSAAGRERDEARARPTYEARAAAPTPGECAAHLTVGGQWLVSGVTRCEVVGIGGDRAIPAWPQVWIPLGAAGLPCAWPVAGEVTP